MMNAFMLFIHVGCKFQHILIYQLEWSSNFLDFLFVLWYLSDFSTNKGWTILKPTFFNNQANFIDSIKWLHRLQAIAG